MTTKTIASVGLALILTALAVTGAEARTRHQHEIAQPIFDRATGQFDYVSQTKVAGLKQIRRKHQKQYRDRLGVPKNYAVRAPSEHTTRIVEHPAGCPARAFCGCGTSLYLLGKAVREGGLAIARNWLAFPRTACAPNMAAARSGHVFAIIECLSGNRALAYDPNAGRHQTHIHVRSLAGYTVVNPYGAQYAQAP